MKKSLLSAVALTALVAFSGNAWADLMVGVAGPITGPNAAFGAQLQKGAEQAVADINAAGGINGEQLKISRSATTFPIRSRASRSPTSSSPTASSS
jgi:branched-chain amino acid transport system substrate-binding protein